jgi:hypothetical protein
VSRPYLTRIPVEALRARYPSLSPTQRPTEEAFCPLLDGHPVSYKLYFSLTFLTETDARRFAVDHTPPGQPPLVVQQQQVGPFWHVYLPDEHARTLGWGYMTLAELEADRDRFLREVWPNLLGGRR